MLYKINDIEPNRLNILWEKLADWQVGKSIGESRWVAIHTLDM